MTKDKNAKNNETILRLCQKHKIARATAICNPGYVSGFIKEKNDVAGTKIIYDLKRNKLITCGITLGSMCNESNILVALEHETLHGVLNAIDIIASNGLDKTKFARKQRRIAREGNKNDLR